jgi:hemin uptake protein HemP
MNPPAPPKAVAQPQTPKVAATLRTIDSQALFGEAKQVLIVHQGETYKLQITRQGKLILTK